MRTTTRRLDRPAIRNCFALIATMLLSAPFALALAAQAGELRLSHQWTANQDARDVAARVFAEELQKRLPQQRVTIHSSSSLVANPVEQYDAMLDGRIEMAIFPLFYIAPKVPEVSITLMPGVPSSVEQARLLKGSEFQTKFQDFCEQKGFHVLGWWWLAGGIVSREADIGAPASYKSLMVRSGDPNFDLMFQAAGAKSKVLSSPKIAGSLKDGSLDVALASLESLVSLKIFESSKRALIGGDTLYVSLHPLMISTKVWNQLSDAEKLDFEDAAAVAEEAFEHSQAVAEKQTVDTFTKAGAQVRPMTTDEYEAWLAIANKTSWRNYRDMNPTSRGLFDAMLMSFINQGKR